MTWLPYFFTASIAASSFSASAAIFSYITESTGTPANATYTYVIERWDEEDPYTPSPCANWSSCYININHKHNANGQPGRVTQTIANVTGLKTMREVRARVMQSSGFPLSGTALHTGDALSKNQECVGLFYQSINSGLVETSGYLLPGSLCGIAPPPVGACRIVESSININYGDIDEVSLPKARKSTSFHVTCNQEMTVLVIASGADSGKVPLRRDNSLKANLYLNNNIAGQTGVSIYVPKNGTTQVQISSELEVNGRVSAGPFAGAGSVILTIP
ncbi:adhesin [Providencia manganoxydans]|uniref:MrpH family fimbial adhesin n=1 Tax=Providencia manganoxydans TaxID=2923283 RepID=UPI0034E3E3CD